MIDVLETVVTAERVLFGDSNGMRFVAGMKIEGLLAEAMHVSIEGSEE